MFAVIFRAEINALDKSYAETARRMRELAIKKYGCTEFVSTSENKYEIAISYWKDLEKIMKWKQDSEHLAAQKLGRDIWYKSYKVEIVQIIREYGQGT